MRSITIEENEAGQRLDKYIAKALHGMPASLMYRLIRTKKIKINKKRAAIDYKLVPGDIVDFYVSDEFFTPATPENAFLRVTPHLNIIFEDEHILLVDKPVGLLVHSDESQQVNTLIAQILAYLFQKGEYFPDKLSSFTPALCNRIDRNTGGIVLAAKTAEALRVINQKLRDREIKKYYLCLVHGNPPEDSGVLKAFLVKNEKQNRVYVSSKMQTGAKSIATRFRVLERRNGQSLLEVELITGRTHQIRAHLAYLGYPLVGDGKYGTNIQNKGTGHPFQALYAYRVSFDFTTDAGSLNYLSGKGFHVSHIPFAENFRKA